MTVSGTPDRETPRGEGGDSPLDMSRAGDRAMLRTGIAHGWNLQPAKLERYARALDAALAIAVEQRDARGIRSCVQTLATLVSQVQSEEARSIPGSTGVEVVIRYADDADAR